MWAVLVGTVGMVGLGTLIGWFVHWLMHQKWSGRLYKSHMTHHLKLYPPSDLLSKDYRDAGADNGAFIFFPAVTLVLAVIGLGLYLLGLPLLTLLLLGALGMALGLVHDRLHTEFHLSGSWLERFAWFNWLRRMHFYHHRNLKKNLGIIWFGWDRLLKSFRRPL